MPAARRAVAIDPGNPEKLVFMDVYPDGTYEILQLPEDALPEEESRYQQVLRQVKADQERVDFRRRAQEDRQQFLASLVGLAMSARHDANDYARRYGYGKYAVSAGAELAVRDSQRAQAEVVRRLSNEPHDGYERNEKGIQKRKPENPRLGRNDLCPCGCGKKVKRCTGPPAELLPASGHGTDEEVNGL